MSITKQPALPPWAQPQQNERKRRYRDWLPIVAVLALGALWLSGPSITESFNAHCSGTDPEIPLELEKHPSLPLKDIPKHLRSFQDCSIRNLQANLSFLDTAHPLSVAEFVHRRDRLAQALVEDGLDAFLVEPGYTFSYYGNVSIFQQQQGVHGI